MSTFHHARLPDHSTLLCGHSPPDETAFQSDLLQIWYNNQNRSWLSEREPPHKHTQSDECFIVLRGELLVEVEGGTIYNRAARILLFPNGCISCHSRNIPTD
jgi:mannose-6-phosphate isomerase-like protein (cupin superfamily)